MTPREKADRASQILSDPVFKHVFLDIREDLVAKLETLPMGDVETQHEVSLMLQLLKQVRTRLERYVSDQKKVEHDERQVSFIDRMRQKIA